MNKELGINLASGCRTHRQDPCKQPEGADLKKSDMAYTSCYTITWSPLDTPCVSHPIFFSLFIGNKQWTNVSCYTLRCWRHPTQTNWKYHSLHTQAISTWYCRARKAGALVQWLKLSTWKVGDRGFKPLSNLQVQRNKMFLSRSLLKFQYVGSFRYREVACSGSDRQGSNF